MSVLIKGGRIVTAADDYVGDVFIDNGTVSLIGESLDVAADKVIDAAGKYVIPGAIDPHTHIEMFFGGTSTCDDFTSGTVSAAFGGTTTLIDFCMQTPGDTFPQALEKYHEKIDRCKPVIDVGFHIGVTDLHTGGTLEDLAKLPDEGVTSYKLFMAYKGAVMVDDETLFRTMETAAETGALVMVHAENGDAIDVIVKRAVAEGKTEPIWHARTRPMETEAEATNRADPARARGRLPALRRPRLVPAVGRADRARAREGLGRAGARPAPSTCSSTRRRSTSRASRARSTSTRRRRGRRSTRSTSGSALGSDVLSVVSTDHCPFNWPEQKGINGEEFQVIPNGGPGHREPPAHAAPLRRARGPHLDEPVRRADLDERREAVRALPAQGHDRAGLRRRHRRLGPGEEADDLRGHAPLERQLQPVRGDGGDRAPRRSCSCAARSIVEGDELVGKPGDGRVREARPRRRGAPPEREGGGAA